MASRSIFSIIFSAISLFLYADLYNVTEADYSRLVEQSKNPVVIDFYASWCPHCRKMAPIFENVSARFPNIRFVKINIDAEPELTQRFDVERLPTFVFLLPNHSSPSFRSTGSLSQDALIEKIEQLQKLNAPS